MMMMMMMMMIIIIIIIIHKFGPGPYNSRWATG